MATHGHGTTFEGTALGTIGEVLNLNHGIECDDIDTSSMDSSNKYRTYISGMIDAGEITFNCIFNKADLATLEGAVGTDDVFTVNYPDTSTWATTGGYIKNVGVTDNFEDKIEVDVTIKVSGEPTFTPAV